ncbi:hypothetical protein B0H14DRAFT_961353 [Mycena olivaceomarginata]|nr:hypothetical protein B0H14DRAFT_961353 [Mycena olivaceomarginata]
MPGKNEVVVVPKRNVAASVLLLCLFLSHTWYPCNSTPILLAIYPAPILPFFIHSHPIFLISRPRHFAVARFLVPF